MFSSYIFVPSSPPLFSWVLLQFRMRSMECLHPSRRIVRDVSSIVYNLLLKIDIIKFFKRSINEGVPRNGRATSRYVKWRGAHLHFTCYLVHCLRLKGISQFKQKNGDMSKNRVTATWSHKTVSHIFERLLWLKVVVIVFQSQWSSIRQIFE